MCQNKNSLTGLKTGKVFNYQFANFIFKKVILFSGILVVILLISIFITLFIGAIPSIKKFGLGFLIKNVWNPNEDNYGAFPFILGTLYTSLLSLLISLPFSLSISILLGIYLKKGILSGFIKSITELLAGIPSVIYGFWGLFFLVPIIRETSKLFGSSSTQGVGILVSSLILAIMIIPYSASIAREVIELVPENLKEAAYALGATRLEVIYRVILPYAFNGIIAGVFLALGRALGETMAVTMLIGNRNDIPRSFFGPANTMASIIANGFNEATGIQMSALIEIGMILMVITVFINYLGKLLIKRMNFGD
jgi:phosphate transport system permease protein